MNSDTAPESPSEAKATADALLAMAASDTKPATSDSPIEEQPTSSSVLEKSTSTTDKESPIDEVQKDNENNNQSGTESDGNAKKASTANTEVEEEETGSNTKVEGTNDIRPSAMPSNKIPHKFVFYKDKHYPEVYASDHNSKSQIDTMSYMSYLRGLVYNRHKKTKSDQKPHELGYRFPFQDIITSDDRPQAKFLANKFYIENKKRYKNVWLYYYPSTCDVKHNHLKEFLKFNFPDEDDDKYIDLVHRHKNTEALCIAVHDSAYEAESKMRVTSSKIIAMIVFRMLRNDESGVFVYYLTTLQETSFNDVCTSPSFQNMLCTIEGNGLGELLLRNTQLFGVAIRNTYGLYLGVNKQQGIIRYYKKLGMHLFDTWHNEEGDLVEELKECVLLEAPSITAFAILIAPQELICPEPNAQSLLQRHSLVIQRPLQYLSAKPDDRYVRLLNMLYDMKLNDRYVADEHADEDCFVETERELRSQLKPDGSKVEQGEFYNGEKYISHGRFWTKYHELWSEMNMVNFWDLRPYFKKLVKDGTVQALRCRPQLMPLEEFLMDHVSVGRVISDNTCHLNKDYNIRCHFCDGPMTEEPLTSHAIEEYNTRIVQAHFTGRGSHILSFNTPEQVSVFNNASYRMLFKIKTCKAMNSKTHYREIFKATLRDYLVPTAQRKNIMIGTNHLYLAYLRQYVLADYDVKMFARAVRGSAKTLVRLENNKDIKFPDDFYNTFLEHAAPKPFSYKEYQEKIHDSIIDTKTKKYFEKRNVKRPLKRKKDASPSKATSTTSKQQKVQEEKYTDNELKENWTRLLLFNAHDWDPKKKKPKCVLHIKVDPKNKEETHWVGRSDIGRDKVYFLVSDNIIPKKKNSKGYVFDKKWLQEMVINREVDIPEDSFLRLQNVVNLMKKKCISYLIPQATVNGKKAFHGRQVNGGMDKTISQEWIDENFKEAFPIWYGGLMDESRVGERFYLPEGSLEFSDSEEDDEETEHSMARYMLKSPVKFLFENKNSCAFGNMANALSVLNNDVAASFFFDNRHADMEQLRKEHTKIEFRAYISPFHLARELIRQKFKYSVKFLKGHDLPQLAQEHKAEVLYVCLEAAEAIVNHVICIHKAQIIDGTYPTRMQCNKESLRALCLNSDYTFHGYLIEETPSVKYNL